MTQTMGEEIAELRHHLSNMSNSRETWKNRAMSNEEEIAALKEAKELDQAKEKAEAEAERLSAKAKDLRNEVKLNSSRVAYWMDEYRTEKDKRMRGEDEIYRLKARISELTQADPSWFDASPADAFRMLKEYQGWVERIMTSISFDGGALSGTDIKDEAEKIRPEMEERHG